MQIIAFYALLIAIGAALGGGTVYKLDQSTLIELREDLATINRDGAATAVLAAERANKIKELQNVNDQKNQLVLNETLHDIGTDSASLVAARVQWANDKARSAGRVSKACTDRLGKSADSSGAYTGTIEFPEGTLEFIQTKGQQADTIDAEYHAIMMKLHDLPKELIHD